MKNLQVLKGFRDILPTQKRQRDIVQGKIVSIFQRFGFEPLETPTLEYKETIMGKYGAEADKLVYQFVDNGDREVALRYDQTVPTARVMAQYQQELGLPFRRYQVQNVFRADKPQKGRYREFTQCDIDIFGSTDAIADAEILATTYFAYRSVGFTNIVLKVNDRQVLFSALQPFATESVNVFSLIQSIDKLDKQTPEEVVAELISKGLDASAASSAMQAIVNAQPSENLARILELARELGVPEEAIEFSPTTARGLDYYTGMIFEATIPGLSGSLGGGGRYDNLIEQLSGISLPAVGMAFGFDRTVEAAVEQGLVGEGAQNERVLVTVFGDEQLPASAQIARTLRELGRAVELYPSAAKLGKQLAYADRRGFAYVIVVGPDEAAQGKYQLKDMRSGEQRLLTKEELLEALP